MPAPTNTTAATAVTITSLPYDIVQTGIHDAGTTYDVWYRYTAVAGDNVLGVWGFGDLVTYRPTTFLYRNDPAGAAFNQYQNRPMYFPVTAGDTWYFKFATNAGNPNPATLTLNLQNHQDVDAPAGSIAIVDTHNGYPVALIDPAVDYNVFRYEQGTSATDFGAAILPSGIWAMCVGRTLELYDSNYNVIATTAQIFGSGSANNLVNVTTNNSDTFYCSTGNPYATGAAKVAKVSDDGTVDATTWTLGAQEVNGIAVSPDETILYYTTNVANDPVRRWDLVNDVALSNLSAGINAQTIACRNCLCLDDGTVIVLYRNSTATTSFARHYAADGTLIATCSLDYSVSNAEDVLARDVDDTNFWVWQHDDLSTLNSTPFFRQVTVATMAIAVSRPLVTFNVGRYNYSETATPTARFGGAYSCPFFITRTAAATPPDSALNGPGGLDILRARGTLQTYPIRRVRISPHTFNQNKRVYFSRFELFIQPGVGLSTGQGQNPTIELHCSNDGGFTYPIQRTMTSGVQGNYQARAYATQLGSARDRVWKVIQTDPVNTIWIGADVDATAGEN